MLYNIFILFAELKQTIKEQAKEIARLKRGGLEFPIWYWNKLYVFVTLNWESKCYPWSVELLLMFAAGGARDESLSDLNSRVNSYQGMS